MAGFEPQSIGSVAKRSTITLHTSRHDTMSDNLRIVYVAIIEMVKYVILIHMIIVPQLCLRPSSAKIYFSPEDRYNLLRYSYVTLDLWHVYAVKKTLTLYEVMSKYYVYTLYRSQK